MQLEHILRIGTDGKPRSLLSFDAQSNIKKSTITQWSDSSLKAKPMVLLLPATWLYQTQTHIPSKSLDVLKKSIPYAIEEELSNEVEDNFYAFNLNANSSQDVLAIEKNLLLGITNAIKEHGLQVLAIYSELDWVPKIANAVSVWIEDDHALIRFGENQVMRAGQAQLSQLIELFKEDLQTIHTNHAKALSGIDMEIRQDLNEHACKDNLLSQDLVDLYLNEIKEEKQQEKTDSWKGLAWLAGVLVTSWLGLQLYQMAQLSNSIDELKIQQQNLFKQAFADAAPVELVDPYAALKSRMQLSTNQITGSNSLFLDTVHHLGMVSKRMKNVDLSDLRLSSEKMEIQISAPNLSVINEFHQQLQLTASQYNVQIGVNELTDDNVYKSILTVTPL